MNAQPEFAESAPLARVLSALPVEHIEVRNGRKLAVHCRKASDWGKPTAATAIFVHGSAASLVQWEHQLVSFSSAGFSVVAYDALGCGRSAKPQGWSCYSTEELYEDLKAMLALYCGTGKVVLVGHSAGCGHLLRLAAEAAGAVDSTCPTVTPPPKLPTALVLIAPVNAVPSALAIFRLPIFLLEWLRPSLSAGFAERAFHAQTRACQTEEHRALIELSEAMSGANPMHMCKA